MSQENGAKVIAFSPTEAVACRILEGSEAGGHMGHVSLIILIQQVLFCFQNFP